MRLRLLLWPGGRMRTLLLGQKKLLKPLLFLLRCQPLCIQQLPAADL